MLDTFRKTFYLVGRDNPARWVALVAGAIVASGLEMLGALLIYLLLALVVDPAAELSIPLLGDLRALVGTNDDTTSLIWAAVILGFFFVLRAAYQLLYSYVRHRLAANAGARLSAKLVAGYLQLPYSFHLQRRSSELVRNAQQSSTQLANQCFLQVIVVIAESFVVVGLLVVMLLVAPLATAGAILAIGAAAGLLLLIVQPRLRRLGAEAQQQRTRTLAALQQSLVGIRDIQVLGVQEHFSQRYRRSNDRLARSNYLRGLVLDMPRLTIETSLIIFILLLFGFSVAAGTATQELLSTLGLFAYAGLRIQPSLQKLISGINSVRYSSQAVDDIHADLLLVEGLDESSKEATGLPFTRELRLEDVSFAYDGSDRPALREVDLSIRPGEFIGICGPTGGGKTTLADLLTGLLDPTSGRVTVDGVDISEARAAWFSSLGVVPQTVFLVDDTLRSNIALGIAPSEVDDEALRAATSAAQLDDVIAELPQGLDTIVGERGLRLSGGQKQRVAIARALYRDPSVLILDEGTSALDSRTESDLIGAIDALRGTRTIIMVAHRLTTIETADRICFISGGEVQSAKPYRDLVENADFREMLSSGGLPEARL